MVATERESWRFRPHSDTSRDMVKNVYAAVMSRFSSFSFQRIQTEGLKDHEKVTADWSSQSITKWVLYSALLLALIWLVTGGFHQEAPAVPVIAVELATAGGNPQSQPQQPPSLSDELHPEDPAVNAESGSEANADGLGSNESPPNSNTQSVTVPAPAIAPPSFRLCERSADFIPCLDNEKAIKALKARKHYEHRERHCPEESEREGLRCLVPLPEGYKQHTPWPQSRDEIWYANVPHPALANYKADQNWVRPQGDKMVFPGGGTQFKAGARRYIRWLHEAVPVLRWGDNIRVALDMGCGVASFAAYLEPLRTRVMSVAPKDEHDAQIQFALERGVSALLGVMGTQRQPYPSNVFDAVHCARCRVPWHAEGGTLLLEVNRLLRPGGFFVWSASPVCLDCKAREKDDREIWEAMVDLTARMCWRMVAHNISANDGIGVAAWQKPTSNECYGGRGEGAQPPMCHEDDNPDAAWYVPMQPCLHLIPTEPDTRGSSWPALGRARTAAAPNWLRLVRSGIYGRPAEAEFKSDKAHWARVLRSYVAELGIQWGGVRNVMDMDARYGGFGATLESSPLPMWTMNVVPTDAPNTLPVLFDRGLLGVYHDWCESFNTYPRTYDLLHADHLLGAMDAANARCGIIDVMVEMDRILRPFGYVIVRDTVAKADTIKAIADGLHWELMYKSVWDNLTVMAFNKTLWRPT